jgi:hypothetical protein
VLHITNQAFGIKMEALHKNPKMIVYRHPIEDPFLAPIMEIGILQLLFYKIAEYRGIKPGFFKFSKKITDDV